MSMPKRVLYLSYTGMTDPLGQSQVLAYLHQLTVSKGYLFTLISFEKEAAYRQHSSRIREFCKKYEIAWHPLRYTKRPPVLSTFIDIWRMRKLAIKLTGTFQFDIVHCRSYIPSLVGLRLKKNERIPFLFDMRGFWADERLDGNIWKKSNPIFNGIYKYFKRKEKQFLKSADHIVSLTQNAKEEILSWKITHDQLPITVIPCCADTDQFNPAIISVLAKESLRHELNISKEAPVISYIGSLGTWYMLEEMLDFFSLSDGVDKYDKIYKSICGEQS